MSALKRTNMANRQNNAFLARLLSFLVTSRTWPEVRTPNLNCSPQRSTKRSFPQHVSWIPTKTTWSNFHFFFFLMGLQHVLTCFKHQLKISQHNSNIPIFVPTSSRCFWDPQLQQHATQHRGHFAGARPRGALHEGEVQGPRRGVARDAAAALPVCFDVFFFFLVWWSLFVCKHMRFVSFDGKKQSKRWAEIYMTISMIHCNMKTGPMGPMADWAIPLNFDEVPWVANGFLDIFETNEPQPAWRWWMSTWRYLAVSHPACLPNQPKLYPF